MAVSFTTEDDGMLGRVPQTAVDENLEQLELLHNNQPIELDGLKKTCENAMKQYLKSRPNPSTASIKRIKEIDASEIGFHPVFGKT